MRFTYFSFFLVLVLSLPLSTISQDEYIGELPDFLPPSPEAYTLGTYGNLQVGLFTGTAQASIPIYDLSVPGFSLPITLDYSSNGVKVDDMAGWVGLGWSLRAGGIISRTIKDLPDRPGVANGGSYTIEGLTIKPRHLEAPQHQFTNDRLVAAFYQAAKDDNNGVDTERDVFNVNFLSYSTSFVVNRHGDIELLDLVPLDIQYLPTGGFIIKTPEGIQGHFDIDDVEKSMAKSEGDPGCAGGKYNRYDDVPFITAWRLSRIDFVNSYNSLTFSYVDQAYEYNVSTSQSRTVSSSNNSGCSPGASCPVVFTDLTCTNVSKVCGKTLSKISTNKGDEIIFISTIGNNNTTSTSFPGTTCTASNNGETPFLTSMVINNSENPARIIDKISLSYKHTSNDRYFLETVKFLSDATIFDDDDKVYNLSYYDPEGLPLRGSKYQDEWGYYTGTSVEEWQDDRVPIVDDPDFNTPTITRGIDRDPKPLNANFGLLQRITYPTKGSTEIVYEGNDYYDSGAFAETIIAQPGLCVCSEDPNGDGSTPNTFTSLPYTVPDNLISGTATVRLHIWYNYENGVTPYAQPGPCYICNDVTDPAEAYMRSGNCTVDGPCNDGNSNIGENYCHSLPSHRIATFKVIKGGAPISTLSLAGQDIYAAVENVYDQTSSTVSVSSGDVLTFQIDASNCMYVAAYLEIEHSPTVAGTNVLTGGMRVKTLEDFPLHGTTSKKRFYYSKYDDLGKSSATLPKVPLYITNSYTIISCGPLDDVGVSCLNKTLNTNSQTSLFSNTGIVSYDAVTVSHGGNLFENGGEEHQFYISPDHSGMSVIRCFIPNIEDGSAFQSGLNINGSSLNGRAKKVTYLENNNGNLKTRKVVESTYTTNSSNNGIPSYVVKKLINLTHPIFYTSESCDNSPLTFHDCSETHRHYYEGGVDAECHAPNATNTDVTVDLSSYCPPVANTFSMDYEAFRYDNIPYSIKKSKDIETHYDRDENVIFKSTSNYYYEHGILDEYLSYPSRIETTDSKGNLRKTKYFYADYASFDPASIPTTNGVDILSDGNKVLLDAMNSQDMHMYSSPFLTQFYENNDLLVTKYTLYDDFSTTNRVYPQLSYYAKADNAIEEIIVFHDYNSNGLPTLLSRKDGTKVRYVYDNEGRVLHKIINPSEDPECFYDRTDICNAMSQVTSYTYIDGIGISSITDPKGYVTTFNYNSDNRLEEIVDQQGNIVESYKYNFKD